MCVPIIYFDKNNILFIILQKSIKELPVAIQHVALEQFNETTNITFCFMTQEIMSYIQFCQKSSLILNYSLLPRVKAYSAFSTLRQQRVIHHTTLYRSVLSEVLLGIRMHGCLFYDL